MLNLRTPVANEPVAQIFGPAADNAPTPQQIAASDGRIACVGGMGNLIVAVSETGVPVADSSRIVGDVVAPVEQTGEIIQRLANAAQELVRQVAQPKGNEMSFAKQCKPVNAFFALSNETPGLLITIVRDKGRSV